MINVDAAQLTALVPAARTLLRAPSLATGVIRMTSELAARDILVHVTTPTSDRRTLRTRWTRAYHKITNSNIERKNNKWAQGIRGRIFHLVPVLNHPWVKS